MTPTFSLGSRSLRQPWSCECWFGGGGAAQHRRPKDHFGRVADDAHLETIVFAIRERAARLRRASNVILGLVVLSVLLGFKAFASAGYITARDETASIEFVTDRTLSELRRATEVLREAKSLSPNDVDRVTRLLSEVQASTVDQTKALREAAAGNNPTSVWATLSTRVASVLLLLFLVQILVTMYRYSIRLAAFYDARADTLQLSASLSSVQLAELVTALSPDGLDFGREPRSPAQHAIDLAKELIKNRTPPDSNAKA